MGIAMTSCRLTGAWRQPFSSLNGGSGRSQAHRKTCHPKAAGERGRHRELGDAMAIKIVVAIAHALPSRRIRTGGVDTVGERVVEVDLRRERAGAPTGCGGADLEVDVNGAATIRAGIDREERGHAVPTGGLDATQEGL